jgi:predicted dehydrogenase
LDEICPDYRENPPGRKRAEKGRDMVKVGVVGLGMMGLTHLDVYAKRKDVKVVAVSDQDPDRLSGKTRAAGNVKGQAQGGFDMESAKKYREGLELIADPEVELVDVCLPTFLHLDYARAVLRAGKHLLLEKPLARTAEEASEIVREAQKAKGLSMCALCIRFWPGWSWLKDAVDAGTYGKVLGAQFRRVASHPGGMYYANGKLCGGAALDLHIHDADFVQHLFGVPKAVYSRGYSKISGAVDHLVTQYIYDGVPVVGAEGSWAMSAGFPFNMQYTVNFEKATAVYDLAAPKPLVLYTGGGQEAIALEPVMGYDLEIDYFLDCIAKRKAPERVTMESAATSVKIVEAEVRSVETGKPVAIL